MVGCRKLVEMTLGIKMHIAQLSAEAAAVAECRSGTRQRQPARRRQDDKLWRLTVVETTHQLIGQFIVNAAADAVDEEIGKEQARVERGRQGARADLDPLGRQFVKCRYGRFV